MVIRKFRYTIIILVILAIVTSCEQEIEFPDLARTSLGEPNGKRSFPTIGSFTYGGFAVEQIGKYASDSTEGFLGNPLPISSSKSIISTKKGKILGTTYATIDWEYQLKNNSFVVAPVATDKEGNIFALTSEFKIISLNDEGAFRFEVTIPTPFRYESFHELLSTTKGILVQSSHGYMTLISTNGSKLWERIDKTVRTPYPCSIENDFIAWFKVPVDESKESTIDITSLINSEQKTIAISKNLEILHSPLWEGPSLVLLGIENAKNFCKSISVTNSTNWENNEIPMVPKSISISDSGVIVIGSYQPGAAEYRTCITVLSANGKLLWRKFFDHRIASPLLLSKNNFVFLGTSTFTSGLYFLDYYGKFIGSLPISDRVIPHFKLGVSPSGSIVLGTHQTLQLLRTRN